jgi:hypothetical protein
MLTDKERLILFREAARQMREASVIENGQDVRLTVTPGQDGCFDVWAALVAREPFQFLARALRLVWMEGEPAFLPGICGVLHRGFPTLRLSVEEVRKRWKDTLDPSRYETVFEIDGAMKRLTPDETLRAWMYGGVFHQDLKQVPLHEAARSQDSMYPVNVQSTVLELVHCALELDSVVATALGELPPPSSPKPR